MTIYEAIVQLEELQEHCETFGCSNEKSVWDKDTEALTMALGALKREQADGCTGCKFTGFEEWDLPCKVCKRNSKDYWRARDEVLEALTAHRAEGHSACTSASEPRKEADR